MSNALALKPPSTIKEALAALIALGIVLGGANLAAVGLKDVLEPTVRSSVVGMVFASVPAVYGFSNRALNGFAPKRLEFPELAPWYITGLIAGACLLAWIQFIGFAVVFALSAAASAKLLELSMQALNVVTGFIVMPLLIPAAFIAGSALNRSTRSMVFLAVVIAAVLCFALSFFLSWVLSPENFQNVVVKPIQDSPAAAIWLVVPSGIVLVSATLGAGWSALWRQRSIGRVAHAVQRLKPDQRDKVFADVTNMLGAQAAAENGSGEGRSSAEAA